MLIKVNAKTDIVQIRSIMPDRRIKKPQQTEHRQSYHQKKTSSTGTAEVTKKIRLGAFILWREAKRAVLV